MRSFYPITISWRDASGRTATTRLFWAGEVSDLLDFALPLLVDKDYNDGIESYLQAASWAAIEKIDGPLPDNYLGYDGTPRYGIAGEPFSTCNDLVEVIYYAQYDGSNGEGYLGPPSRWSWSLPAPKLTGLNESSASGNPIDGPLIYAIDQLNAGVSGAGARWDTPVNDGISSWCSDRGVFLTNYTCLPRRVRRLSRTMSELTLNPRQTEPGL